MYRAVGDLDHRSRTPLLVRDPVESGCPLRGRVEGFDETNPPWLWTAFKHQGVTKKCATRFGGTSTNPEGERAWLEVVGWIPLDDILLVDDLGDAFNEPPDLPVTRDRLHGFVSHLRCVPRAAAVRGTFRLDGDEASKAVP